MRRRTVTCGRKEKQENEIGENLSLEKRKKEKRPARRKNSPEMKDNSQDRLRQIYLSAHTHVSNILFLGSKNPRNPPSASYEPPIS
jgi:hypothetical protein